MTDGVGNDSNLQEAPQRKKFVFKKRDPVEAARLEAERVAKLNNSPFGDAKPRETVIAKRTGKDEGAILQEDAQSYQVKIRLTSEQFAEKKERLDQIEELKAAIASEEVDDLQSAQSELAAKEAELADVLRAFEKIQIDRAKAGDLLRPARGSNSRSSSMNEGRPPDFGDGYGGASFGAQAPYHAGGGGGGDHGGDGPAPYPGFDRRRARGAGGTGGYKGNYGGPSEEGAGSYGRMYQERSGGAGGGGNGGGGGQGYGGRREYHNTADGGDPNGHVPAGFDPAAYPMGAADVDYRSPYER